MAEKKKILVISGNSKMQEFLLESLGKDYEMSGTGEFQVETKLVVFKEKPDLIIFDAMMPDVATSLENLLSLRMIRDIPTVVLAMQAQDKERVRGVDLAVKGYLGKPFGAEELIQRIKAVI